MWINSVFFWIQEKYGVSLAARISNAFEHITHLDFGDCHDFDKNIEDNSVHMHGEWLLSLRILICARVKY